jgi:MFS family permease
VPESRDPNAARGLDWRGALLAFTGLASLVYGLIASSQRGWSDPLITGALITGALLLAAFVLAERAARTPMMPLELFRSRTFSGINALTLLLYGALGGAFFFLPFLLIQARGYPATAAGAAYLPFTLVLAVLSRWGGGLIDRFGARGPLLIGPAVTALGFGLLALSGGAYAGVLAAMVVLGLGMAVTVAPLTTAVINAVPAHRTGVASGINNAVAAVGGLLAIAVLGSLALGLFDRDLDARLQGAHETAAVAAAVQSARGGFVIPPLPQTLSPGERERVHRLLEESLAVTLGHALWMAAALALASAFITLLSISPPGTGNQGRPP